MHSRKILPLESSKLKAMRPDLDIIVVTYNSARVIGDLLDSLPAALDGISAKVNVVDNGSTDETVKILQERGDCHVIQSTNVGYAGGINRGVREGAGAAAILILNPDTRLHENSVAPMLEALQRPGVGIVAPMVVSESGQLEFSLRRDPTLPRALGLTKTRLPVLSEYVQERDVYREAHAVDWALGAALLMSRRCFDVVGGWDESYFLYSEETDLSLRARDLGLATWYDPRAVVMHIGGASGRSDKTHAMQAVNRVRLYRRRHGAAASWLYYWLIIASELTWIPRGHGPSRFAVAALLRPSLRPAELGCSHRLLPG
jgi:N-acetylglucosaminyl-diphospho-decaprenol L-rhamnosyltransferase